MCDKKRERSSNFAISEISLLTELVSKYKLIIENKKTDAVTNKDKEAAWNSIAQTFNAASSASTVRTAKTLKLKYEGIKKSAKKKMTAHRQELYRTGGGPSTAPKIGVIEDKVLSICANISGLDARNDSDNFTDKPDETVEEILNANGVADLTFETTATLPDHEAVETPIMMELEFTDGDDNHDKENITDDLNSTFKSETLKDSQNKWASWNPKALKTKVSQALKPSKGSVTTKLDQLSAERLELVQLQKEVVRNQLRYELEEHQLKMQNLRAEEERKLELHQLMVDTMKRK
ncbi:myb/SANT-like DNA-binding domain-containing protein 4 [Cydia fagiglandana]|uniref:myb/SANT-like DNA-binding domain-containing protein 4 n=1 Tax=Cydia fagiglandana TaxID=1458189 RepID=UPI002FEE3080